MKSVIVDLIRVWGATKVLEAVVTVLGKEGPNEQKLAKDVEQAVADYKRRVKK